MKKILLLLFLLITLITTAEETTKNDSIFKKVLKYYASDEETISKNIPFIYYINEGGLMLGDMYYNTKLFGNEEVMTNIVLYGPETETFILLNNTRNIKISDKWSLGTNLKVIKYEDIHSSAKGNESSVEEISEDDIDALKAYSALPTSVKLDPSTANAEQYQVLMRFASIDRSTLDGYRLYHGWDIGTELNFKYKFNEKNNINFTYTYEYLESQATTYKSDTLTTWYENKMVDDENNPRKGYRIIGKAMKSLNFLGHDDDNDWDYLRLTFDARAYIPVMKKSILALRFRTETTSGKEVVDAPRTSLYQAYSGDPTAKVTTYAPYFHNALLGDLNTFRGFYYNRYFDNHSVLYQAELRIPIDQIKGLQTALFFEAGRVGADYNKDLYTKDYQYCGGIGFRYFFNKHVLTRIDVGFSDEVTSIRISEGQAY